jgi:hypothetical protein
VVFRPALLQPDFRTQNSSRWRLTQALVEPKIDSPGFASNARRPVDFAMLGGDPAAKSLSNVQEGGSDSDAFVWSDRVGMILSSATLRRWCRCTRSVVWLRKRGLCCIVSSAPETPETEVPP